MKYFEPVPVVDCFNAALMSEIGQTMGEHSARGCIQDGSEGAAFGREAA